MVFTMDCLAKNFMRIALYLAFLLHINLFGYMPSEAKICFDEIIKNFEMEMEKKYELYSTASGGRVHDKIEGIEIYFSTPKNYTLDEARQLEVIICERLLDIINERSKGGLFTQENPFSIKNITISISFNDDDELRFSSIKNDYKKISFVSAVNGNILYHITDFKTDRYLEISRELFDEAAKIVHQADATP